MEKKMLLLFFVTLLLLSSTITITGQKIVLDEGIDKIFEISNCEILKEIEETRDKSLEVDTIIGDVHVKYWEHKINDVQIINDSILLQIDINNNEIVEYIRNWREIDSESFNLEFVSFEPQNIFWKEKVIFIEENDLTSFYHFEEVQEFPIACWEVRYIDGTTIMYDYYGNEFGYGAPTPSEGFSLSGYNDEDNPRPLYWEVLRINANYWFKKWCDTTVCKPLPTPITISSYVSDPNIEFFYELAHGRENYFQADTFLSFYYASDVKNDMTNRQPMKFAFIGSCEGMDKTGPGTFSYEFRKGQLTDTVTIGYDGMAGSNGWNFAYFWQNCMFKKMNQGYTIKNAFDFASARYPLIAANVVFVGDTNMKVPSSVDKIDTYVSTNDINQQIDCIFSNLIYFRIIEKFLQNRPNIFPII